MEKKGYSFEAKYIRVIWNWHCSCDQCGLSELQRCRFNYEFLNYILDELIPWHRELYDLSTLEVTRYGLCFTVQCTVCVTVEPLIKATP